MQNPEPAFYFSLPRLLARWSGGSDERTEMNWWEANAVGVAVHGIAYLFAAQLLLSGLAVWQQVALLLPVAILVWICWLIVLYLNTLIVKLLRICGLLRHLPDNRAQSILIGFMITVCAGQLMTSSAPALFLVGGIWIAAVSLNLAAAVVLALDRKDESFPA
jgi:hypothetical protein